jgi:hypothetical protein
MDVVELVTGNSEQIDLQQRTNGLSRLAEPTVTVYIVVCEKN